MSWDSDALRTPATAYAQTLCVINVGQRMIRQLIIIFIVGIGLTCCQSKTSEQTGVDSVSVMTSTPKDDKPESDNREDRTIRIFPLDSILEINFYTYRTTESRIDTSGVNIIDRQKNRWLFDSEGPQIESNSDIKRISDSYFIVSVYYNVPTSNNSVSKRIRIAKYDLNLNLTSKTYEFQKDTLFWPTPPPFNSKDIQNTIADYKKELDLVFLADSTNNDQPRIWKMFKIQERLLSAFISGCDSCSVYSNRLFEKYDHALFASDSDYEGEIYTVYRALGKR